LVFNRRLALQRGDYKKESKGMVEIKVDGEKALLVKNCSVEELNPVVIQCKLIL